MSHAGQAEFIKLVTATVHPESSPTLSGANTAPMREASAGVQRKENHDLLG